MDPDQTAPLEADLLIPHSQLLSALSSDNVVSSINIKQYGPRSDCSLRS